MEENNIIGKWELIAQGYYDRDNNNAVVVNTVEPNWRYIEFLPNGNMKKSIFADTEFPYRIDEQFLYENYMDEENAFIYRYELDNDTLTLEYVQGNIEETYIQIVIHIYQRLKD